MNRVDVAEFVVMVGAVIAILLTIIIVIQLKKIEQAMFSYQLDNFDKNQCIHNLLLCRGEILRRHGFTTEPYIECSDQVESEWSELMYAFNAYYGFDAVSEAREFLRV